MMKEVGGSMEETGGWLVGWLGGRTEGYADGCQTLMVENGSKEEEEAEAAVGVGWMKDEWQEFHFAKLQLEDDRRISMRNLFTLSRARFKTNFKQKCEAINYCVNIVFVRRQGFC